MIPRYEVRYSPIDLASAVLSLTRRDSEEFRAEIPGFPRDEFELLAVRRGREALFVLLKSLALAPGSRVGVPLYVCSCVPHAVKEAGLQPIYIDADPATFGLDLEDLAIKSHSIEALVVVYTLGRPMDFPAIARLLPGKPIIEDCAHAIGSSFSQRPLGSWGTASFFTFGFFKPVSAGGGGLIVSRDRHVVRKAQRLIGSSPRESVTQTLTHSITCLAKGVAFTNPAYSILSRFKPAMDDDGPNTTPVSRVISDALRMRPVDKAIIERYLAITPNNQGIEEFWKKLRERIPDGWQIPAEPNCGVWNHFMFAVQAPNPASCNGAVRSLRAQGVSAAKLFPNCVREMQAAGYEGDCPKSERLASVTLMIPCHGALSDSQRTRILKAISGSLVTL